MLLLQIKLSNFGLGILTERVKRNDIQVYTFMYDNQSIARYFIILQHSIIGCCKRRSIVCVQLF